MTPDIRFLWFPLDSRTRLARSCPSWSTHRPHRGSPKHAKHKKKKSQVDPRHSCSYIGYSFHDPREAFPDGTQGRRMTVYTTSIEPRNVQRTSVMDCTIRKTSVGHRNVQRTSIMDCKVRKTSVEHRNVPSTFEQYHGTSHTVISAGNFPNKSMVS